MCERRDSVKHLGLSVNHLVHFVVLKLFEFRVEDQVGHRVIGVPVEVTSYVVSSLIKSTGMVLLVSFKFMCIN